MLDWLQGGDTTVKLTLDRPVGPDVPQVHPYYLGETVHACVTVASEKECKVQQGRIALVYKEEYQFRHRHHHHSRGHSSSTVSTAWGTDEREVIRQVFLAETAIRAGARTTYEFDLPIPENAAPSTHAEIIRIQWLVKATLDRRMAGDIEDKIELPVCTRMPGPTSQPIESGVCNQPDEADLVFCLPRKDWVMGETIVGSLRIIPKKDFDIAEVRVELVRSERVPRDLGNERQNELPFRLRDGMRLQPGLALTLPFNIAIPSPVPATLSTPHSTLDWRLRGVLARRFRKDTTVEQEIAIYNNWQA